MLVNEIDNASYLIIIYHYKASYIYDHFKLYYNIKYGEIDVEIDMIYQRLKI